MTHIFKPVETLEIVLKPNHNNIYVTSDLHLNHKNIIEYCNRPFRDLEDMNQTLIYNWNHTVRKKDTVFFLGDLAFQYRAKKMHFWTEKLSGNITYIKGNHDWSKIIPLKKRMIINYRSFRFYLVHKPQQIPPDWEGWAITGHKHNKYPEEYPIINHNTKIINVSTELTDYKPIRLDELVEKIR